MLVVFCAPYACEHLNWISSAMHKIIRRKCMMCYHESKYVKALTVNKPSKVIIDIPLCTNITSLSPIIKKLICIVVCMGTHM